MPEDKKGSSTLSKKRFNELKAEFDKQFDQAEVDKILNIIKDVMLFDPDVSTYTKEKGQKTIQWVKDKKEATGLSFYVVSGKAKQYAKKKLEREAAAQLKE